RRVVDIEMREHDIGEFLADADDDFAPQLGGFEHVVLVDRAQLLAAQARGLESGPRDPLDLRFGIHLGVEADALSLLLADAARLPEIDAAGMTATEGDVKTGTGLGLQ